MRPPRGSQIERTARSGEHHDVPSMKKGVPFLYGSVFASVALVAAWVAYRAWENGFVDVAGLRCTITDTASGEKNGFALLLRKQRKDVAPTSLWTQDGDNATPKPIYRVCETTADALYFKPTEVACGAGTAAAEAAGPGNFDFAISRKTLELTIGQRRTAEHCEEANPSEVRAGWRKAYADRVKGNHF